MILHFIFTILHSLVQSSQTVYVPIFVEIEDNSWEAYILPCHLISYSIGDITKAESIKIDKSLIKYNSTLEFHHLFPRE